MINDLGFLTGYVMTNGGWFLLVALFVVSLLMLGAYGWGRRDAFREVDERRAVVLREVEDAAAPSVAGLLPSQRQEQD